MKLLLGKVLLAASNTVHFIWTAPAILFSAFLIAWGAEAAQFMVAQGLALAILAWLQTLPEFAVEADLAWSASKDPTKLHFVTANFTGSIRLIMGFGMPIVYFIFSRFWKGKQGRVGQSIDLDPEHSVEVVNMIPATIYLFWIWWKGSLHLVDSVVLLGFYIMYLFLLLKMPPEEPEDIEELPYVSRMILKRGRVGRIIGLTLIFLTGGGILYLTVHPFVDSLKDLAVVFNIAPFFFIQWIAPFLSEFPEKVSAFNWARQDKKAPMALMNFLSSNVNQLTVLIAMIPIVFCIGSGSYRAAIHFDAEQKEEVLLTACQAALVLFLLLNMKFEWWDAVGIFVLWAVQFFRPSLRDEIIWVYLAWMALELFLAIIRVRTWSFPMRLRRRETALRPRP